MTRKLFNLAVAGLLAIALPVLAAGPAESQRYVVERGDTLWDIAATFFDNPWQWPEVWYANPAIKDPNLIYPGDVLTLTWQAGKPTVNYKPEGANALQGDTPKTSALSSVDPTLLPYLQQDTLVEKARLVALPHVLGSTDGRQYLSLHDTLYVDASLSAKDWQVFRVEKTFLRPATSDASAEPTAMVSLKHVADGRIRARSEGRSVMTLTRVVQEVRPNDVLLPLPENTHPRFWPQAAQTDATLLGHLYGSEYVANGQLVVLDKGANDGVSAGQMFAVTETGANVVNGLGEYRYQNASDKAAQPMTALPDVTVGQTMVVRAYPRISLAVITQARQPIKAGMHAVPPSPQPAYAR
ncbi:LysM peptidoglycan-binding domain-containing protein [Salinivibrio kushneri]|uniref:LysM peptidoglycan-binding domain-containing protein n=1 Tax=Salinivibrio kushneri TaxID=1908198 RepID=A0AA47KKF8_9GAMM|nr:LysM peptidoglycan-binding domain-containing protein [Salinivibrio kushneri]WBA08616.1 LysM peptidoglycan-binding domain-containing protein [Salinivibrio kushneri]